MSVRSPRFLIHRVDSPAESHYRAFWRVEGKTYRVHVWDHQTWERLPTSERPGDARPLEGPGWMVLRSVPGGPH